MTDFLEGKKSNAEMRYLTDPYKDWLAGEGIPVHDDFCVNLHELPVGNWPRYGMNGAAVHLKGRGDFISIFLYELAPGAKSAPIQHLFEEVILVVEGHGSATIGGLIYVVGGKDDTGRYDDVP